MIAAVLKATGRDADHIRRQISQHLFSIVKSSDAMQLSRRIRPLLDDIANANQFSQFILHVKFGVPITNRS